MLGRRLLHYEILEQLGEGGMGVVYKARDTRLERLVAIKVLPANKTADPERKRRFMREAQAASALNHPNIITIHDITSDGNIDFMVMEHVAGKGLDQVIPGGLPPSQTLKYAVQISSALAKAHSAGIIHRDLKPANIMIGPDDHIKLLDFGLAKLTEVTSDANEVTLMMNPKTEAGMIVGTANYMSPEQAEGKPVDGRSDIFSFGAVMYEMITGRRAFQQETVASTIAAILGDEPKPVSEVTPAVSRDLERVVARCLRKNPDRRYQTMTDLRIALEDLKEESDSGKESYSFRQEVKRVFLTVCSLDPTIQRNRLDELCGANQQLLQEVQKLLKYDSKESLFEEARVLPDEWIGRTIQNYKLLECIGEGGMGVVYRGEDVRLKRPVALKFLNTRMLGDESQRERFLREAQAAALLDHPSICAVYDIGEQEGRPYIVTAYLAGETLEKAIQYEGLSPFLAIEYVIQIAEGLQAAHAKGIVHRDLKPSNVILARQPDGSSRAKIIDFGLASVKWGARLTAPGGLIGTALYICPELLQGKPVEEQADIWSLGIMLYEMLVGHPPFEAENRERLFYLICNQDPQPLTAANPALPEEAGYLVFKALEKDGQRRYQKMESLLEDLRALKRDLSAVDAPRPASPASGSSKQVRRRVAFAAAGGLLVAVAATMSLIWLLREKNAVRPPPEMKRLTFDSGLALHPAVSPDGKYVAFASDRAGEGNLDIWVQTLSGGEPVRLTKDAADEDFPSFSPDGTKIAFQSERDGRGIYSVPVLGGEPRLLAQKGIRPRYSPDGQRLSFADPSSSRQTLTSAVFVMPAEGGERTEFRTGFLTSSNPIWSPDASRLLYAGVSDSQSDSKGFSLDDAVLGGSAWYSASISGGPPVRIEPSTQFARFLKAFPLPLAWLRSNRILFSYASGDAVNLWLATLSPDNRRIIGTPEQLTFGTDRITDASVAGSGAVVFAITATRPRLWNVPLETRETGDKGHSLAVVTNRDFTYWPSLSDTGKLVYVSQTSDRFNLWLRDLPSGKETLLASLEGEIHLVSAYINRTGTQVGYTTLHESKPTIYTIGAGGGTPEKVCEDCGQLRSWSPERRVMLSQDIGNKRPIRIYRIDAVSGRKSVLLENSLLYAPDLSPDGHWVAFQARAALSDRREQLFLAPMSDGAAVEPERWIAITELKYFDANPLFSRDGKILYFNSDRDGFTCLWAVRLDPATKKPLADPFPVKHFHGSPRHYSWYPAFGVGPDRIIINLEQVQSDLWMTKLPE